MNIRVLRKLAWFALPVMGLFVSCGEDDDTSWKDRLGEIEQTLNNNNSTIDNLKSQMLTGDYVTSVELVDGKVVATTEKGQKFELEIEQEAVKVSVVPKVNPETGVLTIETQVGDADPVASEVALPVDADAPTVSLDGNKLTVGDETVEIAVPNDADATVKVENGKIYLVYTEGGEEKQVEVIQAADGGEIPGVPAYTIGMENGVVTLYADGVAVDGSSFSIGDLIGDSSSTKPYVAIGKDGGNYTIEIRDSQGNISIGTLPASPVVITDIELVGKYVDDKGVPQETTPVKYLVYEKCKNGKEVELAEILPGVSYSEYNVNPQGINLDEATLATVDYLMYDGVDLETVGSSDGGQLNFDATGATFLNGVMTVGHKIDWNPTGAGSVYPSAYWYYMSSEDDNVGDATTRHDPIATLSIADPTLGSDVLAEDHGLFKVPFGYPSIRPIVQIKDELAKYDPQNEVYRHNMEIYNSGADFVLPAGTSVDLSTLVDGIAHRMRAYSQQEGTSIGGEAFLEGADVDFTYFNDPALNIQRGDYEFEWKVATEDDLTALEYEISEWSLREGWELNSYDVSENEINDDWGEKFSFDAATNTLSADDAASAPYNKLWVKVRMKDVEDGVDKYISLHDDHEYFENDHLFPTRWDDEHENLSSYVHEKVHRGIRSGEECEWMYFEVIIAPDYIAQPIAVDFNESMTATYYDYYKSGDLTVNNNYQGTPVSLNDFMTTQTFDFEEVVDKTAEEYAAMGEGSMTTIDFVQTYGVGGDRDGLLLPRSIQLKDQSGNVLTTFATYYDESTNSPTGIAEPWWITTDPFTQDVWSSSATEAWDGYNVYSYEDETRDSYPFDFGHLDNEDKPCVTRHFVQVIPGMPIYDAENDLSDFCDDFDTSTGWGTVKADLTALEGNRLMNRYDRDDQDLYPVVELDFIWDEDQDINDGGYQDYKVTLPTCLLGAATFGESIEKTFNLEFVFGHSLKPEVTVNNYITMKREVLDLPIHEEYWFGQANTGDHILAGNEGTMIFNGNMDYEDGSMDWSADADGYYFANNDVVEAYRVKEFRETYPIEIPAQNDPIEDMILDYVPSEREYLTAALAERNAYPTTANNEEEGIDITVFVDRNGNGLDGGDPVIGGQYAEHPNAVAPSMTSYDNCTYDLVLGLVDNAARYTWWHDQISMPLPYDPRDVSLLDVDDIELFGFTKAVDEAYDDADFFFPYLQTEEMEKYFQGQKFDAIEEDHDYPMFMTLSHVDSWGVTHQLDKDDITLRYQDPFSSVEVLNDELEPATTFDVLAEDVEDIYYILSGRVGVYARAGGLNNVQYPVIRPNVLYTDELSSENSDAAWLDQLTNAERGKYYGESYYQWENGTNIEAKYTSYLEPWSGYFLPLGTDADDNFQEDELPGLDATFRPLPESRAVYGPQDELLEVSEAGARKSTDPIITFAFDTSDPTTAEYTKHSGKVRFEWVENQGREGELRIAYKPENQKIDSDIVIKVVAFIDHRWAVGSDHQPQGAWGKLHSKELTFIINPSEPTNPVTED